MGKYLDAVGIITLVILLPITLSTTWMYVSGELTFDQYSGSWKEPAMLLIGFWIRGATSQDSQKS